MSSTFLRLEGFLGGLLPFSTSYFGSSCQYITTDLGLSESYDPLLGNFANVPALGLEAFDTTARATNCEIRTSHPACPLSQNGSERPP